MPRLILFLSAGFGLGHKLLCPFLYHLRPLLWLPGIHPFTHLCQVPEIYWLIPGPPRAGVDGGFDPRAP